MNQQLNQLHFTQKFRPAPSAGSQVDRFIKSATAQHEQEIAHKKEPAKKEPAPC